MKRVDDLDILLDQAWVAGARSCTAAGGFPIKVPPNISGFTGSGAWGRCSSAQYEERLMALLSLAAKWPLVAASTYGQYAFTWKRCVGDPDTSGRQV